MLNANPAVVSTRAKKRGLPQSGTLGQWFFISCNKLLFLEIFGQNLSKNQKISKKINKNALKG